MRKQTAVAGILLLALVAGGATAQAQAPAQPTVPEVTDVPIQTPTSGPASEPTAGAPTNTVPEDPGPTCQQTLEANGVNQANGAGCDTKYTPIAKDGSALGWTQIAGAVHPDAEAPKDYENTIQNQINPVPATVDFYTVSFENPTNGLAGGAQCADEPTGEEAVEPGLTNYLKTCIRVPVIYRYTEDPELGGIWREAYRGDTPGFVGAITWLHNQDKREHGSRALAVGGTGSPSPNCPQSAANPPFPDESHPGCGGYPRREPAIPFGDADEVKWRQEHDPAGQGRAWLFSDADWQEIEGSDLPSGMRGMTALDASLEPTDCAGGTNECAMAGALQQIWMWKDGAFDRRPWKPDPTAQSPGRGGCTSPQACRWFYRVRAIRFLPPTPRGSYRAMAVTGGCCTSSPNPAMAMPRVFNYTRPAQGSEWAQFENPRGALCPSSSGNLSSGDVCDRGQLADSIYALTFGPKPGSVGATHGTVYRWSYLATPGGPEQAGEPPAQIIPDAGGNPVYTTRAGSGTDLLAHWASSVRLVGGDGDFQGNQLSLIGHAPTGSTLGSDSGPDAFMDWAVGGFKGEQRAVAYTTITQAHSPAGVDGPFPLVCPAGGFLDGSIPTDTTALQAAQQCKPDDQAAEQTRSRYLFQLSSYFLNGFAFAGESGVGWAVGDRGAIERLAGNGDTAAAGTLPPEKAPILGAKQPGEAPPREPYEASAPEPSGEVGIVPPREAGEVPDLDQPALTPYGSPNQEVVEYRDGRNVESVTQIAMSRDGSEGWAVGGEGAAGCCDGTLTLYHFDGSRWRRCSTNAVEGVMDADPACAALWPLRHAIPVPAHITAIARIPMEYGEDPSSANEFEAIAAAKMPDGTGRLLRYSKGRWEIDNSPAQDFFGGAVASPYKGGLVSIAFSGPSDGWLVDARGTDGIDIWHFDGEHWTQCAERLPSTSTNIPSNEEVTECADHNQLFPVAHGPNESGSDSKWSTELLLEPHLTAAGDRIYLYGHRQLGGSSDRYPMILYRNPGECHEEGDPGCWQQAYDPGCIQAQDPAHPSELKCAPDPAASDGVIAALSVAQDLDGSYNGWGIGNFDGDVIDNPIGGTIDVKLTDKGVHETPFIHSGPDGTSWEPVQANDTANDYLLPAKTSHGGRQQRGPAQVLALPGPRGQGGALASPDQGGLGGSVGNSDGPTLWFDPASERWRIVQMPYPQIRNAAASPRVGANWVRDGYVQALAPDGAGGAWIATVSRLSDYGTYFYRFSNHARAELFSEKPHPIRETITAAAGGGDASFWVATDRNVLYRYDRLTGWDRIAIPGWDPGRFQTSPSPAYAIAIGQDGNGVVVGGGGRIADIGPGGAALDAAAGVLCSKATPPCGTGRDLKSASVAPDGSAMVGGDNRALLYRQGASGAFGGITLPPTKVSATITGISMPAADRVWAVTDGGQIYAGALEGSDWTWTREDTDPFGDSIVRDEFRAQQPLRAIAIDASGHGYAVGPHGTIAERTGDGPSPWRRVSTEYTDQLRSVALGPGGKGALIVGDGGLILTETAAGFEPARVAEPFAPTNFGYVSVLAHPVGVALLPGYGDGQVEAWAATQAQRESAEIRSVLPGAVFHYTSDPSEPLLDGGVGRARPLPDASTLDSEAISFAAFGNSECTYVINSGCSEIAGSNETNDIVARRIRDEVLASQSKPGGADFALFSGDVGDIAGSASARYASTPQDRSLIHDRWRELIADPLLHGGVPTFGAIGARDLTDLSACPPFVGALPGEGCARTKDLRAGSNMAWRQSMAPMRAPWGAVGKPEASSDSGLTFEAVDSGGVKQEREDLVVEDPTKPHEGKGVEDPTKELGTTTVTDPSGGTLGDRTVGSDEGIVGDQEVREGGAAGDQTLPTGGAHTHYAVDVVRDGQPLLRVVVLDTSLRSLSASNAEQNPIEEQLGWLREVLGSRPAGERAVVVSNTPTYSYAQDEGGTTDVAQDGAVLEQVLMQNDVDLVITGRLGWNALYWALAPGAHYPCPGSAYPDPEKGPGADCGPTSQSGNQSFDDLANRAQDTLLGEDGVSNGALPFLVAHSAGGKFGPNGQTSGTAAEGYWRGYTMVHLDPASGEVSVEQRPVFDWIGVRAITHVLRAGQKMKAIGFGREALGIDADPRYDQIDSPAITHRYDLLYANPDKPWLAATDDAPPSGVTADGSDHCGNYICIPSDIGTIHPQTGQLKAGKGNHERTFAIALLSVGDQAAQWPLAMEPRASFKPKQPKPILPKPLVSVAPQPPEPPAVPNPQLPQLNLPSPPTPPILPVPGLPPTATPTAPPAPPPPPVSAPPAPLALTFAPTGLTLAPQSTVVPPPAPPIQPAPPGGARKEARQRQAAAAKSEEGADSEGAQETKDAGGDMASEPPSQANAATRGEHAATRLHHGQPSAWVRDLEWGGGLTLAALLLAFGWSRARPTPRRREPEVPAPAWAKGRRRR